MKRETACLAIAGLAIAVLGACSNQDESSGPSTPSASPPPATASATATVPANAEDALAAFNSYIATLAAAQAEPTALGKKAPADADVSRWTWDPVRAQLVTYIANLAEQKVHFEGVPPVANPRVESVNLTAKPWPTVVISNCPVGDDWHAVSSDGSPLPEATTKATPAPPYRISTTMIKYKGHWGAYKRSSDSSSTCTP